MQKRQTEQKQPSAQTGALRFRHRSPERRVRAQTPSEPPLLPRQLELFESPAAAVVLEQALSRGEVVGLLLLENRISVLPQPFEVGQTCGYWRRAIQGVLDAVQREGRGIWVRPAGKPWDGWIEWGTLTRTP